jgi:hypothetical protein
MDKTLMDNARPPGGRCYPMCYPRKLRAAASRIPNSIGNIEYLNNGTINVLNRPLKLDPWLDPTRVQLTRSLIGSSRCHSAQGQASAPWRYALRHSQVHAMAHAAPPAPHRNNRRPEPRGPAHRPYPSRGPPPHTNTHDRQSTPWLYSPLDRRAEFIGSGCD